MMGAAVVWSIVVVLLLAVTATAVVLIARGSSTTNRGNRAATAQQTGEILRNRYANGDIDAEEYRRRLNIPDKPT
ncbi:SHOCT domain-containing protein [Arthrobacter sp. TB 23]|uniref:SHOCT domain-containing protein n=1 Tax=Arthrobacter sp. TB 23 TaxID=494419 RepID=UPI0002E69784|nr:hypothetical protein [Arthrobacter sp. TB 23]